MKFKIPLIQSKIESDILWTFALTPLWWALGFNFFIYHLVVFVSFMRLMMISMKQGIPLKIPQPLLCFGLFLVFYMLSILVNLGYRPPQRIFASLNNYLMLIMGFIILLILYNIQIVLYLELLLKTARLLCLVTGVLAVISLILWFRGYENLEIYPLAAKLVPGLMKYPYFYSLMVMKLTITEPFIDEWPRLSLYSGAPTSMGGFMLMIIPPMVAYYQLKRKSKIEFFVLLMFSIFALLFSLARAAICGFIAAYYFVSIISKRRTLLAAFIGLLVAVIFSGQIYQGLEWMFNVRSTSNVGRFILYQEALKIVARENLIMGLGVRLRESFTTMSIIGSHSWYVELLFVTGLIGLLIFILFQFLMLRHWLAQRRHLKTPLETKIWKYLGFSFIAVNLWLATDTLTAYPFMTFGYFLITGSILSFGSTITKVSLPESLD